MFFTRVSLSFDLAPCLSPSSLPLPSPCRPSVRALPSAGLHARSPQAASNGTAVRFISRNAPPCHIPSDAPSFASVTGHAPSPGLPVPSFARPGCESCCPAVTPPSVRQDSRWPHQPAVALQSRLPSPWPCSLAWQFLCVPVYCHRSSVRITRRPGTVSAPYPWSPHRSVLPKCGLHE